MTTETLTLTDFLLARIAEDEAGSPFISYHEDPSDEVGRSLTARVLAECEAKRRIVKAYYPESQSAVGPLWTALEALATVYVDHPDYREEW